MFIIASNSGVNGSIVGLALKAKETGHKLIAVTSLEHTKRVTPKHPSGKRLYEVADVVVDNRAPFGDSTLEFPGGIPVGAVSSITAAFIAQMLTIGTANRIVAGRQDTAALHLGEHPRRRRAQPRARSPLQGQNPAQRMTLTWPVTTTHQE